MLRSYVSVETDAPCIALTFDDGPDAQRTPAVLEALAAAGAHATFFVVGLRTLERPEVARAIVADGHELGVHGYRHVAMTSRSPLHQAWDLVRAKRAVRSITGTNPRWFRAPYGSQSRCTVALARANRLRPVMWSAAAEDWTDASIEECVALSEPAMQPGGIVLLHDGNGSERKEPSRTPGQLADLVDAVLTRAREGGLAVVSFGELVQLGKPRCQRWLKEWPTPATRRAAPPPVLDARAD